MTSPKGLSFVAGLGSCAAAAPTENEHLLAPSSGSSNTAAVSAVGTGRLRVTAAGGAYGAGASGGSANGNGAAVVNVASSAGQADNERGLHWSGVSVTISTRNGPKKVLDDCSGWCRPGEVACIIGPSGAGKTSLFNALCGIRRPDQGATVTLNGRPLTRELARNEIAFVAQEDSMFATVTPREAMAFSARLRLPRDTPSATITEMVDNMLQRLGLTGCADTLVGDAILRGISGGEKKRTAIGVELITQPQTLFLDEPTSGLDSYAALQIARLLRQLADEGCTVMAVLHQPSSEIFAEFDKIVLMAKGSIVYGGAAKNMLDHFSRFGFECPPQHNPADFVLFLMQTEPDHALERLREAWAADAASEGGGARKAAQLTDKAGTTRAVGDGAGLGRGPRPGFFVQLGALISREFTGVVRNKPALVARFGLSTFLNLFFALIFFRVGTNGINCPGPDCTPDVNDHFGAICNIAIGLMFGAAQPTLLAFPLERPTFLREYGTATYGTLPYFISKTVVEVVLTLAQSALIFAVVYWVMELRGNILFLILAGFGLSLVANSLALVLGCGLSSVKVALELSPLIFVPQILFSGVFIKIQSIPVFLRWVQYLCSLKWALNIMMVTEFSSEACEPPAKYLTGLDDNATRANYEVACDEFLDRQDVARSSWPTYVGVLAGVFFATRVLAALLLQAKAV